MYPAKHNLEILQHTTTKPGLSICVFYILDGYNVDVGEIQGEKGQLPQALLTGALVSSKANKNRRRGLHSPCL